MISEIPGEIDRKALEKLGMGKTREDTKGVLWVLS